MIEDHYRICDAIVGDAVQYADDDTLVVRERLKGLKTLVILLKLC